MILLYVLVKSDFKLFLEKLEISDHWARIGVGQGNHKVSNARWGSRGTGLPTLSVHVKYDLNFYTITNIPISKILCKLCNQLLLRNLFSGNLRTLKIKNSPFTLNFGALLVATAMVPDKFLFGEAL